MGGIRAVLRIAHTATDVATCDATRAKVMSSLTTLVLGIERNLSEWAASSIVVLVEFRKLLIRSTLRINAARCLFPKNATKVKSLSRRYFRC